MRIRRIFFYSVLGTVTLLANAAQTQVLNVKTGAWESSVTSSSGGILLPPEMLSKLVPESQREKFEEAIGALPNESRATSRKYCLSQNDLNENKYFEEKSNDRCSRRIVSKTSERIELEQNCNGMNQIVTANIVIQAINPESVKVTVDALIGGVGKKHTEMSAHWTGATCQGKVSVPRSHLSH